jgi:hypothetical protein
MRIEQAFPHDSIRTPARALVAKLANRIEREFGLRVMLAYEKEGYVEPVDAHKDWLEYNEAAKATEHEAFAERINRHRRGTWQNAMRRTLGRTIASPEHAHLMIDSFHHEAGANNHFEWKSLPAPAQRAVQRVDDMVLMVESHSAEGLKRADRVLKPTEKKRVAIYAKPEREGGFGIRRVDFNPFMIVKDIQTDYHASGLHINFSLWDENGSNICADWFSRESTAQAQAARFKAFLHANAEKLARTDLVMLASSQHAFSRLQNKDRLQDMKALSLEASADWFGKKNTAHDRADRETAAYSLSGHDNLARMEFRLPDACARHDLSTLFLLTALYLTLEHQHGKEEPAPPAEKLNLPSTWKRAAAQFTERSAVLDVLRETFKGDSQTQREIETLNTAIKQEMRSNKQLAQPSLFDKRTQIGV